MLGQKLARRLLDHGTLSGPPIREVVLADQTMPVVPESNAVDVRGVQGTITSSEDCDRLVGDPPDVIFHMAAVVSGQAEADFDIGYLVNVDGTRQLCEAIRRAGNGYLPRVVFSSSIAVYCGPYQEVIDDDFHLTPRTSYGAQKAIGELLISDYAEGPLQETLAELVDAGYTATSHVTDISDPNSVETLVEHANHHGDVSVLVNSAGITVPLDRPVHELALEEFRRTVDVNLWGTVYLTKDLLPQMLAAG